VEDNLRRRRRSGLMQKAPAVWGGSGRQSTVNRLLTARWSHVCWAARRGSPP